MTIPSSAYWRLLGSPVAIPILSTVNSSVETVATDYKTLNPSRVSISNICLKIAVLLALYTIIYSTGLAIYRLYFSELSSFPGPKLAAATHWYEFYFDFFRDGKYIFEIEKMHQKYGPIVRVNPCELSIHDPDFYDEVYVSASRRRTEHYDTFIKGIDFDGSHLLTRDHDLHRRRRKPLEPFFSRLGVSRLQAMLAEVIDKFEGRLRALSGTGSVIRLDHAFSAFSGDIIGKICWEDKEEFLDDPDFAPDWYNVIHMIIRNIPLFTGFPQLIVIASMIPESVLAWLFPTSLNFNDFSKVAKQHIEKAKRAKMEESQNKAASNANTVHTSLFRYILDSDMPESERSDERLAKEAQVLLGGGTASTARTLGFISYYVLANEHIRKRLQAELRETMSSYPQRVPTWAELEQIPFLQALVKEGLRLSYGVMHRLPRCSPDVAIQYKQWTIPRNVPVGMSAYLMHSDAEVYPNPKSFIPERWLGDIDPRMNRNFVPFCRGSRNCLGMNLAQAEIYLALAILFRPGGPEMQLFETDETDVIQAHDFLIPLPKITTKGTRVMIL